MSCDVAAPVRSCPRNLSETQPTWHLFDIVLTLVVIVVVLLHKVAEVVVEQFRSVLRLRQK